MFKRIKKISTKLLISFIVVAVISSIAGITSTFIMRNIDSSYSAAMVNYGFAQGSIGKLGMAFNDNKAYVRDIVFLTEPEALQAAKKKVDDNSININQLLDEVRPTNTSPEAKALFKQIEDGIGEYRTVRDQVISYGMSNEQERAYTLWTSKAGPMIDKVAADAEELLDMNLSAGTQVSADLTRMSYTSMIAVVAIIIIGLLVSVALSIIIARSISGPIIRVQQAAKQLAAGDLNLSVESDLKDEVGQMSNSFAEAGDMMRVCISDISRGLSEIANGNFDIQATADFRGDFKEIELSIDKITVSLSHTLGQINQSSDQVASGSDQVASGAQALSQGATEQASSIQQLSATISEISEQVKKNAENSNSAKKQSENTSNEVVESNRQMQEMIEAMNEISSKSAEISKIIKTIEDIAFQTNILALNAAVEAARAGAAGKGFAVVADEVRNLAGKSAEAAQNTTSLIEETIKAVENGTQIADGTAKAMLTVVDGTKSVTGLIIEIADASNEQSSAVNQVTLGVEQISAVVQNNSATAEESAAASEELSGQAQILRSLVSKFKLKNEGMTGGMNDSMANSGVSSNHGENNYNTMMSEYLPSEESWSNGKY